jgi:TonB family protein
MSFLETWVATPFAAALGWTVLHSIWQGAILAAALVIVLTITRSPRVRYTAACLAMLAMSAAFGLTLVRELPRERQEPRTATTPAAHAPRAGLPGDLSQPSDSSLAAYVPWLAPLWIAGVWIFYLKHAIGWIAIHRLRRRGVCGVSDEWQQHLRRLSQRLRLTRPVRLLESCLVDAPLVLGHFRPMILMPVGLLAGLPAEQMEAILLHELAHIRRYDYLVNIFQRFVEGLLFYHPAVWWMSRVIRTERENCCDDVVVALNGKAHEYAAALAALEQNRGAGRELAVAATGGSVVRRIRRLLYPPTSSGAWTPLFATVALLATAAVALTAWQQAPAPQTESADTSPYGKWLNEDVLYIITDRERAEYKKLTTDGERDQFIEHFWLVRDPTPGTPENELKEEHYRRIAFANEHFASANLPGWKTDRGRIYIPWGPPDEIDAHSGDGSVFPYEMWRYRSIEGLGQNVDFGFTDLARNGEYRLTLDPFFGRRRPGAPTPSLKLLEGRQGSTSDRTDRIRVGAKVQERSLITKVDPVYPPAAMRIRLQGTVRFSVVIAKDGHVSNTQLINGHPLLVEAAGDALRQWVYKPTLLNGEPVEVVTEADVNFLLTGK